MQQRAIRMITNLKGMAYEDRLRDVGLTSLVERRISGDMITIFGVMSGRDRVDSTMWFDMSTQREGVISTGRLGDT